MGALGQYKALSQNLEEQEGDSEVTDRASVRFLFLATQLFRFSFLVLTVFSRPTVFSMIDYKIRQLPRILTLSPLLLTSRLSHHLPLRPRNRAATNLLPFSRPLLTPSQIPKHLPSSSNSLTLRNSQLYKGEKQDLEKFRKPELREKALSPKRRKSYSVRDLLSIYQVERYNRTELQQYRTERLAKQFLKFQLNIIKRQRQRLDNSVRKPNMLGVLVRSVSGCRIFPFVVSQCCFQSQFESFLVLVFRSTSLAL